MILARKMYADPEVIRPWSVISAGKNVTTLIHAQSRGDLQRLYTVCLLTGMDYNLLAIPTEFRTPRSTVDFNPIQMTALFEEGRRVISAAKPWRTLPPGIETGESVLARMGQNLTFRPRGPLLPISGPKGLSIPAYLPITDREGIQAVAPAPFVK